MLATVVVGVLVFTLGQTIQKFLLEPLVEQRKVIGDIAKAMLFLANIAYTSQNAENDILYPQDPNEASRHLRSLAARLRASLWTIPFYGLWSSLRIVHNKRLITEVSQHLVGWSHSLSTGNPSIPRAKIVQLLKLPTD